MFAIAIGTKADEPLMEELRLRWELPDDACAWQASDNKLLLLYAPPTPLPPGVRTVRYEREDGKVTFKLPEETAPTEIALDELLETYDERKVTTAAGSTLLLLGAEESTQRLLLYHAP